jgi:Domain of unknown function (DUF1992)
MLWLESIAERKICEAVERGELAGLPGEGRPLDLIDDGLVPEELRMGYRVLKNAGVLPPELEVRKQINNLEQLVLRVSSSEERSQAVRKLNLLRARFDAFRRGTGNLRLQEQYYEQVVERLAQR